jgi:hypothetical protein
VAKKDNVLKIQNAALRYRPAGEAGVERQLTDTSGGGAGSGKKAWGSGAESAASGSSLAEGSAETQHEKTKPSKTGRRETAVSTAEPALAPGQLWQDSQKIQFPAPPSHSVRPGVVWVLDAANKPEPKRVMLGITDGVSTEVVSGNLKQGDKVIVADTSQENAANSSTPGVRSPFGFAPGRHR